MDLREFSALNRTRCESPTGFNHTLESWTLSDWFTATAGELGEAGNVIKKLNRIRDGIPGNNKSEIQLRGQLRAELADVFIYLDLLAQAAGFDLASAVEDAWNAKSVNLGYPVQFGGPTR